MDMNEFHFMHIHNQVVEHVKSNKYVMKCVTSLRINSFISASTPRSEPPPDATDERHQFEAAAIVSASPGPKQDIRTTKCRSKKKKKCTPAVASVGCGTEIGQNLVDYTHNIATQTDVTCFERDFLKEARLNYLVDEIRIEDFDSDLE